MYLSAILAGLTLSMMMTCLLQNMEVDRATPRLDPDALATSTSSGPDAVATESDKDKQMNNYYHLFSHGFYFLCESSWFHRVRSRVLFHYAEV